MKSVSNEWDLLVDLCQLAIIDSAESPKTKQEVDWEKLFQSATHHRVRPLLYLGISKWHYKNQVPKELLSILKNFTFHKATFNLNQAKEMMRILELFESNEITAVPYKGVVLAQTAFQNIAAREFSDVDLMIKSEDIQKAKEVLLREKYQAVDEVQDFYWDEFKKLNCELSFVYKQEQQRVYQIDMHWNIGNEMYALDLGYKKLSPFVEKQQFLNATINAYTAEGLLLTTCLHHIGKEHYLGLKHICDIAAIISNTKETINWELLLHHSRKLKVLNYLLTGIGIANQIFSLKLPEDLHKLISSKNISSLVAAQHTTLLKEKYDFEILSAKQRFFSKLWYHIHLRESYQTKIKILLSHLMLVLRPNRNDYNGKKITIANYFWLMVKKPFRLFSEHFD